MPGGSSDLNSSMECWKRWSNGTCFNEILGHDSSAVRIYPCAQMHIMMRSVHTSIRSYDKKAEILVVEWWWNWLCIVPRLQLETTSVYFVALENPSNVSDLLMSGVVYNLLLQYLQQLWPDLDVVDNASIQDGTPFTNPSQLTQSHMYARMAYTMAPSWTTRPALIHLPLFLMDLSGVCLWGSLQYSWLSWEKSMCTSLSNVQGWWFPWDI